MADRFYFKREIAQLVTVAKSCVFEIRPRLIITVAKEIILCEQFLSVDHFSFFSGKIPDVCNETILLASL